MGDSQMAISVVAPARTPMQCAELIHLEGREGVVQMTVSEALAAFAKRGSLSTRRSAKNPGRVSFVKNNSRSKRRGCMSLTIAADMSYLPLVRRVTQEVAEKANLDKETTYDIMLAVGEACANAIEHGSKGPEDEVQIVFSWSHSQVRVEVQDSGPGCHPENVREPDAKAERGFGMYLMRSLMDNVEFICGGKGTKVVLIKHIRRDKCLPEKEDAIR